jgi:hypothetical protein
LKRACVSPCASHGGVCLAHGKWGGGGEHNNGQITWTRFRSIHWVLQICHILAGFPGDASRPLQLISSGQAGAGDLKGQADPRFSRRQGGFSSEPILDLIRLPGGRPFKRQQKTEARPPRPPQSTKSVRSTMESNVVGVYFAPDAPSSSAVNSRNMIRRAIFQR